MTRVRRFLTWLLWRLGGPIEPVLPEPEIQTPEQGRAALDEVQARLRLIDAEVANIARIKRRESS